MVVLHIPSHGLLINGIAYLPAGDGPHPVVVICHGLPGNEKNLDIAQTLRRAGYIAVTFNYRGSWGSPGSFSFAGNLEDADAVLDYLADPHTVQTLGADSRRIALVGHSMGGWVTAHTAAHHPELKGAVLISAADMGRSTAADRDAVIARMRDDMESLAGVTAESMADELIEHGRTWRFDTLDRALSRVPVLVLSSDDGLAPQTDRLVIGLREAGCRVEAFHASTDHGWSDHRIELQQRILRWLHPLMH
jgi:dienelactone hydrolase